MHKQLSQRLLVQFPLHIHPYIDDIVNFNRGENCEFRVIASLLRYYEEG